MASVRKNQLRRTINPYVGQIVILSVVTLGSLLVSVSKGAWGLVLSMPVAWIFFGALIFIGMKYKISWDQEMVCQKASGGPDLCIKYDEISEITSEVSKPGELLSASRPFRRIVIYDERRHGKAKFIDVSLKHFVADDIRELMRAIRVRRPDLTFPKHWV